MNTPKSREGNLIRYLVYAIGYLMAFGTVKLVAKQSSLKIWDLILFVLITAMVTIFYIYRFNREQRFFKKRYSLPWLGDFGFTVGMTILITALRILVMYFQTYGKLNKYGFQISYLKHESVSLFWFLMLAQGILLPILQEFLASGFLFNYMFRNDSKVVAITGIIVSGLIFSILNFQPAILLFLVNMIFGMIFAWSYLYSQSLWMPLYLAVLNGMLMIVMI